MVHCFVWYIYLLKLDGHKYEIGVIKVYRLCEKVVSWSFTHGTLVYVIVYSRLTSKTIIESTLRRRNNATTVMVTGVEETLAEAGWVKTVVVGGVPHLCEETDKAQEKAQDQTDLVGDMGPMALCLFSI